MVPPQALPAPPGRLGGLVAHLRDGAMYPVTEVALCTALGVLAGIAGRAYATPGKPTGLNVLLLLLGRTGSGKEALHEMAGYLRQGLRAQVAGADALISFADFASGPAMAKECALGSRCMVNFASEFGRKLKRMGNANDTPMQDLRTTIVKLYSKSGPNDYVGPIVYSQSRVEVPGSVAYSLVGESTPSTAFTAITADMAEDGFASRVQFVQVPDVRPPFNEASERGMPPMPDDIGKALIELAVHATTLMGRQQHQPVEADTNAWDVLRSFRVHCEGQVNTAGSDELSRSVWNRAHLKALKYASLLAVFEAPHQPRVSLEVARWAIRFAEHGVATVQQRIAAGEVGSGDHVLEQTITRLVIEFLEALKPIPPSYGIPAIMQRDGVVPRKYLQQRTSGLPAFNQHKLGTVAALDLTLRSMVDSGYFVEMDKTKAGEAYTFQGRCFRVVNLPGMTT